MIFKYKDPSELSVRELMRTYCSIDRLCFSLSVGSDIYNYGLEERDTRALNGVYMQYNKYSDECLDEIAKRAGIHKDDLWDYGDTCTHDPYDDFRWLLRRCIGKYEDNLWDGFDNGRAEFERIMEKAGYIATRIIQFVDGEARKDQWVFTGNVKLMNE